MRPQFQQLDGDLADRIITEAKIVLAEVGVDIGDVETRSFLADHGAGVDNDDGLVRISDTMVEAALDTILMLEKSRSDGPVWQIAMSAAQKTYDEATNELDELEYEA